MHPDHHLCRLITPFQGCPFPYVCSTVNLPLLTSVFINIFDGRADTRLLLIHQPALLQPLEHSESNNSCPVSSSNHPTTSTMSNPENYTIGWICALTTELVAAQAFLDERHEDPDHIPVNDNNSYVLGRIGKHNVVIAPLPHGQYGLVNAAAVARDMVRSFPNVRLGLMVGVGGGAPTTKHDIRLGDVVVSSPGHGNGGVFQYDYGKTIQDKRFITTGTLNQPSQVLLTAMATLEAEYKLKGHGIQGAINNILVDRPKLKAEFQRPNTSTDRLYKSSFIHAGTDKQSCAEACGDMQEFLIERNERSEHEDDPAIHYGLIASANQLMKNALIRDELATEKDVLCFERGAAGLMNHFSCVVVRGICDYSDSHSNSQWQGYAAMTAAAYAKDLLGIIAPNKFEAEKKPSEVLLGGKSF